MYIEKFIEGKYITYDLQNEITFLLKKKLKFLTLDRNELFIKKLKNNKKKIKHLNFRSQ